MSRIPFLGLSFLLASLGVVADAAPARPLYLPVAPPIAPVQPRFASLAGTSWQGTLFSANCSITFNADATLTYRENGNATPGSWRQDGAKVYFDINKYSEYDTTLNGDHLVGTGRNKAGMTCKPSLWRVSAGK